MTWGKPRRTVLSGRRGVSRSAPNRPNQRLTVSLRPRSEPGFRRSRCLLELATRIRAQAKTPRFKRDYPTRSNVERTVAQVATQNGRRVRLRYIGTAASDAWLHTRCAALNLRTLLRHGLTRVNGSWAIA